VNFGGQIGHAQVERVTQSTAVAQLQADFAAARTPYAQLQAMLKHAPSRQVGQPGNDVIDQFIEQYFSSIVAAENDATAWSQAQAKLRAADQAHAQLNRVRMGVGGDYEKGDFALERLTEKATELAIDAYNKDREAAAALAGQWQHGRITYNTATFLPGEASMALDTRSEGAARVRIYQLAPNLVEPANLPEEGFTGPIVYVGAANPNDLAGKPLEGAAVLVDFNSAAKWVDTAQLGARVILVLEPAAGDDMLFTEAAQKQVEVPISVPRFFVKRADLSAALGGEWSQRIADEPRIHLAQKPGVWKSVPVSADWLFVPGSAAPMTDGTQFELDPGRQLVVVQAYKDSRSIVPELSPGARGAGNLVTMFGMIEQARRQQTKRPTLYVATNDHTNGLMGDHYFGFAAFAEPSAIYAEVTETDVAAVTERFIAQLYGRDVTEEFLETFRAASAKIAGREFNFKTPATEGELQDGRNRTRDLRNRLGFELAEHKRRVDKGLPPLLTEAQIKDHERRIPELDAQTDEFNKLAELFNRFGTQSKYSELHEDPQQKARLQKMIRDIFADISKVAAHKADVMDAARTQLANNLSVRRRLMALSMTDKDVAPTTAAAAFTASYRPLRTVAAIPLDLSYGTDQVGLFHMDMQITDDVAQGEAETRTGWLARFIIRQAEEMATERKEPPRIIETLRGAAWQTYLGGKFAFASRGLNDYRVPALTLTNTYDNRPYDYSPDDTAENVNPRTFNAVSNYSRDLLTRVINADGLGATVRFGGTDRSLSALVTLTQKDKFSIQVPKVVVPDALLMVVTAGGALPGAVFPNNAKMFGQVSPWPVLMTDARGGAMVRGGTFRAANLLAFSYTPDYRRVLSALDFNDGEKRLSSVLSAGATQYYISRSIISAEFVKVDLLGLTQPLTLAPATTINLLDVAQESTPQLFSAVNVTVSGAQGGKTALLTNNAAAASIFIDHGMYFKITGSAGLALNSVEGQQQGIGFASTIEVMRNLPLVSAKDMLALTQDRLDMLEARGVKDSTGDYYNRLAIAELDKAEAARDAGENDKQMRLAEMARGYGNRAYTRALGTINDLIKAVVIFLALVIPFCFFVTKLITPFTDANRQLGLFAVVFFVMATLLRFLHPAFKVARTPEVVILAFIILGLALFVASVLIGRFNSSMTQAVEESQMSESVEASQGRLAGVAFLVGVNNMRRRRIRTTLTCATIVLVTFTMLSVISVGQDVEPTTRRTDSVSPYSGVLYAREGLTPIDAVQMRRLKDHLQQHGEVVARTWAERKGKYGEYLPYQLKVIDTDAEARKFKGAIDELRPRVLVGLQAAEADFLGAMPLAAGRWFISDDAPEVVLSVNAAELLGILPDHVEASPVPVQINGRQLRLVGLVDDTAMAAIKDLSGVPLLPMLSQAKLSGAGDTAGSDANASGSLFAAGTEVARPSDVAFVAIDVARSYGDAGYRMLAMRAIGDTPVEASTQAWLAANQLIQFQDARVTVGLSRDFTPEGQDRTIQAGQYTLASSSSTEIGGVLKVAIPVILAATIILNTMLGSVMERRREVGIYNAIGLNPGHVMMFFLAESLVFGLVGSVAGYLIGQALSLIVVRFPDLGLNLNYSSLSVLVVIFLAIATVLLSTVYPAMMAARAAVPSGQRRWSLPQPEGDTIHLKFPFSYDSDRVLGVCAYLHDFMRQNSEASTGKFLAKLGPVGRVPLADGVVQDGDEDRRPYAMLFDIAPAPFDLGVNQKMEVYAYFDERVHAHMLAVYLTRISGERGNWVTVNQPFLESLRKRLLGWRSQKQQTQTSFYEQGRKLFANAKELPTIDAKQELA
jgi:hypothetical protein